VASRDIGNRALHHREPQRHILRRNCAQRLKPRLIAENDWSSPLAHTSSRL